MSRFFRLLRIALLIYVLAGALLYILQDALIFRPTKLDPTHTFSFAKPFTELNLPVSGNSTMDILQFKAADSSPRGVVLYFHGNKKNIEHYAQYSDVFTRLGYEVWMMDYPGYGKSTGSRTEAILYRWAEHFYRLANSRFAADSIVVYGKSLGSGIAAYLASRQPCKSLILETPYYDLPRVARQYLPMYPMGMLMHYKLPTHQYLTRVKAPVTLIHGTRDRVIFPSHSNKLARAFKSGDTLIRVQGGSHNDLFQFEETISALGARL